MYRTFKEKSCCIRMKDLINTIVNGDCIQVMKGITNNQIDLVVTSPPYNLRIPYDKYDDDRPLDEYTNFIEQVAKELYRITKDDGRVCVNIPCDGKMRTVGSEREKCDISYIIKDIFYKVGFKYRDKIYWDKQNVRARNACGHIGTPYILLPFEEIVIFYKENRKEEKREDSKIDITLSEINKYAYGHWKIEKIDAPEDECLVPLPEKMPFILSNGYWEIRKIDVPEDEGPALLSEKIPYILINGHWEIKGENKQAKDECPAPFPEEIPYRLIKLYSYVNDVVLDPFAGSGTTCVVAKKLQRKFIGIEISEKYANDAKNRLSKV